jgi:hypothetical protein
MDAATCAKIIWVVSGSFSGDSDELIKIRRAFAEAIFNTDGKGFPKPIDPPVKVLESKEWIGCKNAALEIAENKQSSEDSKWKQIKFILLVPNGLEDKPDTKSPTLNISWPVTSETAYQAGPVFDGSNRKVHLLGYRSIDQERALSEPGLGSEGLYPIELRDSLPPKTTSPQPPDNRRNSPIARLFFGLAIVVGSISMYWIADVAKLIRTHTNLILSETTVEKKSDTKKIINIAIKNENEKLLQSKSDSLEECLKNKDCSEEKIKSLEKEITGLKEKQNSLDKVRPCIEKINEQLKTDSSIIPNHRQCTDILFSENNIGKDNSKIGNFILNKSLNNSHLSLMWPFILSQVAIILLLFSAGFAIKGKLIGAFINTRNRVSLSGVQQSLWTILIFGGFTILAIFNIALLADYARSVSQYNSQPDSIDLFVYFPSLDPALWAALGLTVVASPLISKGIAANKKGPEDGSFGSLEIRQDKSDTAGQPVSNQGAKWTDIFTDESQENSNTVDINRLQYLVITGLLLGSYFIFLSEYISNINAASIFYALITGQAVFTQMPPVDGTFIGLMALSHAGYLGFKALPTKTNS